MIKTLKKLVAEGNFLNLIKGIYKKPTVNGTSLVVQWLSICLPVQGMQVQSLVGELRSHMPWGMWPACHNY